jgi:hypothetical protein
MIRADRPGIDRYGADAGQGGVASVAAARRDPDPPEHGAFGDPGRLLPGSQGADRTEFGGAVGSATVTPRPVRSLSICLTGFSPAL